MGLLPDLKRWYHSWHCVWLKQSPPISLLQHLKSLNKSFSQFETEFRSNTSLFKILHFSTGKKSPRALGARSLKFVQLDDQLTWRYAASIKVKLKIRATLRHRRERAAPARWRPISNVYFLVGLTSYMSRNFAVGK
jgi:hypothetical protein